MPSNNDTPLISAENIESAFSDLHTELKIASSLFSDSTAAEDAGLRAVIYALRAVLKFLEISPETVKIYDPLLFLYAELRSLQKNAPSPMLNVKFKAGHPHTGIFYHAIKGVAVFTVRLLLATGMSRTDSRKAVAAALNKKGFPPGGRSGKVSERTIRKWEDDIGIDETATKMLQSIEAGIVNDISDIVNAEPYRQGDLPLETSSDADNRPVTDGDIRRVFLDALSDLASIRGHRKPPYP